MCRYLVTEVGIPIEDSSVQTPLFWQIARGTSSFECSMELKRLGADPFWYDPISGCSPFSLAVETLPDFALKCLEDKAKIESNRGTDLILKWDYFGIGISALPKDYEYNQKQLDDKMLEQLCEPLKFHPRKPVLEDGWETFAFDSTQSLTIAELMFRHHRWKLLQTPIMRNYLYISFRVFASSYFNWELAMFALMVTLTSLSTSLWPFDQSTLRNKNNQRLFDPHGIRLVCTILIWFCLPSLVYLVKRELSQMKSSKCRKYLNLRNIIDCTGLLLVMVMCISMCCHVILYPDEQLRLMTSSTHDQAMRALDLTIMISSYLVHFTYISRAVALLGVHQKTGPLAASVPQLLAFQLLHFRSVNFKRILREQVKGMMLKMWSFLWIFLIIFVPLCMSFLPLFKTALIPLELGEARVEGIDGDWDSDPPSFSLMLSYMWFELIVQQIAFAVK